MLYLISSGIAIGRMILGDLSRASTNLSAK